MRVQDMSVGGADLTVKVAETQAERYMGLQGVRELPADISGMLFLYKDASEAREFIFPDRCHFPLDVVFSRGGVVMKVGSLSRNSRRLHSGVPVDMVLEVPKGFAEQHGIRRGDELVLR